MDRTAKTIYAYDKNCYSYEDKFMDFPLYSDRVREFMAFLKPGASVLDLGCGPGNVARQLVLSGQKFQITGVDLSEEMIRRARTSVPEGNFLCLDVREINFSKESFDAVFLSFCIVHLTFAEASRFISKSAVFLKPQGKLFLSFMEGKPDGYEKTSFSGDEIYYFYHWSHDVIPVLERNGLSVMKLTKQGYPEEDGTITTDVFIYAEKSAGGLL